jgi:hypothetical protein
MRRQIILSAVIGIGSAALFAGSAFAGGWGCGHCGIYPQAPVTYAPPTYSYAPPTYTIVPHVVVQPNYIVERTRVVRPTYYVREPAPCLFACGGRYVVNQGQYAEPALVAPAALESYSGYAPAAVYPRYYHRYAPVMAPRYYQRHVYPGYVRRNVRHYAVTTYRVNRRAAHRVYHRSYYR